MERLKENQMMFSTRYIVAFALPIIFENIMAIMAGLVDTVMVSGCGEAAVGAVALVDGINTLTYLLFSSFITGGTVVTAQYIGNRDFENAKSSSYHLLYGSVIMASAIMLVLLLFIPETLTLVFGELDPALFENAKNYFFWTLFSYPFMASASSTATILRTQNRSGAACFLFTSASILNVIGNAVLIYGFDLGVTGAAISTTFSRIAWTVMGLIMLRNKDLPVCLNSFLHFRFDGKMLRRVLNIGVSNGIEGGLFQIGKLMISRLVASLGTVAIAANSVAVSVANMGWVTISTFGMVLLNIVGQCMGAGETEQAKYYTKKITNFAVLLTFVVFGAIFLLRYQLASLFAFEKEAFETSVYLIGVSVVATVFSVYAWAFTPVSAFRAAGDTKYAVVIAVSTMFIFRVGLAYLLGIYFNLGLLGVWIGTWGDWICRSICNFIRYRSEKWLTKKVI